MRMANKTNVNANKEAETVEEVKAVDDAPVTEGTDVQVNEEETVPADNKEEAEAAKPKPVSKGNRRGSKALQLELEKAKAEDEIRQEIIKVATAMAGKIVTVSLTEEQQNALLEETLKEMGDDTWLSR